jgi:hypothetical protein
LQATLASRSESTDISREVRVQGWRIQGGRGRARLGLVLGAAGGGVAVLAVVPCHERGCVAVVLHFVGYGGGFVLQGLREHEVVCGAVGHLAAFCGLETLLLAGFASAAKDAGDDLDAAETRWG